MIIDSHAHINFSAFKDDREEIIKKCLDENIWIINVGSQYDTSKKAIEIAEKYEKGVYATIGLHPMHLNSGLVKMKIDKEEIEFKSREEKFDYEAYRTLAKSKKVVAIGETGFDYYFRPKTTVKKELFKQKQKEAFLEQLKLAKELNLPVIYHCRMANKDLFKTILEYSDLRPKKAVAHSFVGNMEELKQHLDFGNFIGFNGIIFKNIPGMNFEEIIFKTPIEKILIETDCPYLSPPPEIGERNSPLNLRYIIQKIAGIKKESFEKIKKITTQNAKNFFEIDKA
jgi:TatD DNase family protein